MVRAIPKIKYPNLNRFPARVTFVLKLLAKTVLIIKRVSCYTIYNHRTQRHKTHQPNIHKFASFSHLLNWQIQV